MPCVRRLVILTFLMLGSIAMAGAAEEKEPPEVEGLVTWSTAKNVLGICTAALAVTSFIISRRADSRAKRAEEIKELLGERESVAFAALKILRDGFPSNKGRRRLIIDALLQACVFESSDRARALLYRVIELHRVAHREEFKAALTRVEETFQSMGKYAFTPDELDLARGLRRVQAVEKVVNAP